MEQYEQRISALEKKVDKLEEFSMNCRITMIEDKTELKELIKEAIEQAIVPLFQKFDTIEKRVTKLEDKDKEKALLEQQDRTATAKEIKSKIIGTIITVIVTAISMGIIQYLVDKFN